ncbi:WG repeat-containing protein [Intestinimonas sp. HCP28S3_D6]|uniref:WG repeat-containing protein n=1 Tax=Intestinimonas sp. HCP28S3_D6 TaxID=3438942 RepID=UPI003F8BD8E3
MNHRLPALLLGLTLTLNCLPALAVQTPFNDVPEGAWYAPGLNKTCEIGLMSGVGGDRFAPEVTLTYGELYAVSARLLRYYQIGSTTLPTAPAGYRQGENIPAWVLDALWYLEQTGAAAGELAELGTGERWDRPATREDLAQCLWGSVESAQALSAGAFLAYTPNLTEKNIVAYLPDTGAESVLSLCRMGVLTGVDSRGTYAGDRTLTRAELATALGRLLDPNLRLSFTLETHLEWENFTLSPIALPEGYRIIWPADPDPACYFSDGIYLHMDNGVDLTDERSWTGHREGILDMRGTWALEPVWHTVSQVKSNGMADVVTAWPALIAKQVLVKQVSSPVTDGTLTAYQDAATGLWGFQDAGQTAVIPARYAVGSTEDLDTPFPFQFKNGYAVVGAAQPGGGVLCGLIDEAGNEVLPCVYDSLGLVCDGLIYYRQGGTAGYWNVAAKAPAFTFSYTDSAQRANPFSEGLCSFAVEDGGVGYLDKTGELAIPDLFDWAGPVLEGKALVILGGRPYQLTLKT